MRPSLRILAGFVGIVLMPCSALSIRWDFGRDGDTEGWKAYGNVVGGGGNYTDLCVEGGVLKINVRGSEAWIQSPRLGFDTGLFDRITARARISRGTVVGSCKMYWRTPALPATYSGFKQLDHYVVRLHPGTTCTWTEDWQTFQGGELYAHENWTGKLIQFQLVFALSYPGVGEQEVPDEVWVDYIELTGIGEQGLERPLEVAEDKMGGQLFDAPIEHTIDGRARWMWGGDLDGDGDVDMVLTARISKELYRLVTLLNNGDGTLSEPLSYEIECTDPRIWGGDVDGDGAGDLVMSDWPMDRMLVYLNQGDATFSKGVAYPTGDSPTGLCGGDLDADGDVDVVVANWGSGSEEEEGSISVLFNDGDGVFGASVEYEAGIHPSGIYVADLDLDGDLDVAVASEGSLEEWKRSREPVPDPVYVLFNDGRGVLVDREAYVVGDHPYALWGGDLDRDGYVDLVVINGADSHSISVLLNQGDGFFARSVEYRVGRYPRSICGGDFDGDGDVDLALGNWGEGSVEVLLNRGDGTFSLEEAYPLSGPALYGLFAEDLDGDGDMDIAGTTGSGLFVMKNRNRNGITYVMPEHMDPLDTFEGYTVSMNAPNPFNAYTIIPFQLALSGRVNVSVYDLLGRKVRTLVDQDLGSGKWETRWEGRDDGGREVGSGMYVVKIEAGEHIQSRKVLVVR